MNKRIFIAGPVSAKTNNKKLKNIKKANDTAKKLVKEGNLVYIPQNYKSLFNLKKEDKNYSLKLSKTIIKYWATHIYLIKGWEESKGATEEYTYAKKNKLKIIKE